MYYSEGLLESEQRDYREECIMAKNVTSADIFGGMFNNIPFESVRAGSERDSGSEAVMVKRETLHEFSSFYGHPYRVIEDDRMYELADSIREAGIIEPLRIRPDKEKTGEYEIIAGHRRNYAAGLAGLTEVPAYILDLDDDAAAVMMVDSNNRREVELPSERAWAYRTKAEALRHQGKRTDLEQAPDAGGMSAVGEKNGDGARTVQRYIRLTYLIKEFLDLVDEGKMAIGTGYLLSFFNSEEQGNIERYCREHQVLPDKAQIAAMSDVRAAGKLDADAVARIMSKREKAEKPVKKNITLKDARIRQYFPENATSDYMEQVILQLLEKWSEEKREETGAGDEDQQLSGQMDIEDYPEVLPGK